MSDRLSLLQANRFYVGAILLALALWPIGFNLGAHDVIFYSDLLQIWIVSLVALGAGLYLGRRSNGRSYMSATEAVVLILPTLWLISEIGAETHPGAAMGALNMVLSILSSVFAVPSLIRILLRVNMPETTLVRDPRLTRGLILIAALVFGGSWLIGRHNGLLFTCDDFTVSGDSEPANCRNAPEG